jgi:hypothetical protein
MKAWNGIEWPKMGWYVPSHACAETSGVQSIHLGDSEIG